MEFDLRESEARFDRFDGFSDLIGRLKLAISGVTESVETGFGFGRVEHTASVITDLAFSVRHSAGHVTSSTSTNRQYWRCYLLGAVGTLFAPTAVSNVQEISL